MDFAVPVDHIVKLKESEKKNKNPDFARELKKETVEREGDSDTNCIWCSLYSHQRIGVQWLEDLETIQTIAMSGSASNWEES